jgi:hypothetical protein
MLGTVFFSALIASEGVFTCTANITGYHAVPAQLQNGRPGLTNLQLHT